MVHLPPEAIHFVLLDRDIGNDLAVSNPSSRTFA